MPKVLYIAGDGRSGSTLLNMALGNHPEILAMGELCNIYRYILGQNNWCACGVPVRECPFWNDVRGRLSSQDIQQAVSLQAKFETSLATICWPRLDARIRASNKGRLIRYRQQLLEVCQTVLDVSGRSILVDASKLPGRAMAMAMMPEIDLYLIHLVRDSRALVWARARSWQQNLRAGIEADVPARSTSKVCLHWNKSNLLVSYVRRQLPSYRSIRVRYEDFVTSPEPILQRVGSMMQVDLGNVATMLRSSQPLDKGHIASGNRMRMGEVKLEPDFRWVIQMPSSSRHLTWALTGSLLKQYGYQRRSTRDAQRAA